MPTKPDAKVQELLTDAARKLRILDIFVRSSQCRVSDDVIPTNAEKNLAFQYRFQTSRERTCIMSDPESAGKVEIVEYLVTAQARFLSQDHIKDDSPTEDLEKGALFGEVSATFSAVYLRNDCSSEGLSAFGRHNVPLHVWPYWRELLQNTLPRMRLPPITLGMYQAGQRAHAPATMDGLLATDDRVPARRKKARKR